MSKRPPPNPPWTAEFKITTPLASRLIAEQFPELLPLRIDLKGEGWDNVVFQVNTEFLFRFPRRMLAVDLLESEGKVLPQLSKKISFPIPTPVFRGSANELYPWPFLGYRFLEGQTACTARLDLEQRTCLAPELGRFLFTLHQISEEEALSWGAIFDNLGRLDFVKRREPLKEYLEKIENLELFPKMSALYSILDETLHLRLRGSEFRKSLLHGDLYARHLLVDSNRCLTGVIDWGDVHIGNPALDLQIVYSFLPPESHSRFYETYGQVNEETRVLARFRALWSSCVITVYGHSIGDLDLLHEGQTGLNFLSQSV